MFAFFGMPGFIELVMIFLSVGIVVIPFWFIFSKAGFPGVLSLLMLLPLVNLAMIFFLAFAEWPALKHKNPNDSP